MRQKKNNSCFGHIDYNNDDERCQECPPSDLFKEMGVLLDLVSIWNTTYATFSESVIKNYINYVNFNHLEPNKDGQEGQECSLWFLE